MTDDYEGQMIFGDLVGLKLPDIRLTGEEKPRKKHKPGKLTPQDRTRSHKEEAAMLPLDNSGGPFHTTGPLEPMERSDGPPVFFKICVGKLNIL